MDSIFLQRVGVSTILSTVQLQGECPNCPQPFDQSKVGWVNAFGETTMTDQPVARPRRAIRPQLTDAPPTVANPVTVPKATPRATATKPLAKANSTPRAAAPKTLAKPPSPAKPAAAAKTPAKPPTPAKPLARVPVVVVDPLAADETQLTIRQGGIGAFSANDVVLSQGGIGAVRGQRLSVELGGVGAALT